MIMGMYTQLVFGASLDKEKAKEIIPLLQNMMEVDKEIIDVPNHPFFQTSRWRYFFQYDSAYFDFKTNSQLIDEGFDSIYLNVICNLKNYGSEIEKFLDWIDPYLDNEFGEFLGFSRYEENKRPTLIYKK